MNYINETEDQIDGFTIISISPKAKFFLSDDVWNFISKEENYFMNPNEKKIQDSNYILKGHIKMTFEEFVQGMVDGLLCNKNQNDPEKHVVISLVSKLPIALHHSSLNDYKLLASNQLNISFQKCCHFFVDDPNYSLLNKLNKKLKRQNHIVSPWYYIDSPKGFFRKRYFQTSIKGSVGSDMTRVEIIDKLEMNDNTLTILSSSKSLDVMYSSCFQVETKMVISKQDDKDGVLFETYAAVFFNKPVMFVSSLIRNEAFKSIEKEAKLAIEVIQKLAK